MTGFRQVFQTMALRLSLVVWTFGYILVEAAANLQGRSAPGQMFLANVPLLLLGVAQTLGLAWLLQLLSSLPGYVRWPLMAGAAVLAGLVQTAADHLWLMAVALAFIPSWQVWALEGEPMELVLILLIYLWTICLSIALIMAARAGDQVRLNEARAAAFEAAAARAEAAALRLQLNPHFLFNTLNGIASLVVRKRQDEAEEMIGRLADFLRASLAANPTALVTLAQELDTVTAYLDIEKARFGARLQVAIKVAPELLNLGVPNFLLQPLVENAIKYGVARSRKPVTIVLAARQADGVAVIAVANRTAPDRAETPAENVAESSSADRPGIGLANTRQRLKAQYGEAAWLTAGPLADGYRAEIGLPLTRAQAQAV